MHTKVSLKNAPSTRTDWQSQSNTRRSVHYELRDRPHWGFEYYYFVWWIWKIRRPKRECVKRGEKESFFRSCAQMGCKVAWSGEFIMLCTVPISSSTQNLKKIRFYSKHTHNCTQFLSSVWTIVRQMAWLLVYYSFLRSTFVG